MTTLEMVLRTEFVVAACVGSIGSDSTMVDAVLRALLSHEPETIEFVVVALC